MADPEKDSSTVQHRFSFHSANAMLPLVKSIARDVYSLLTTIRDTRDRLAAISVTKSSSSRKPKTPQTVSPYEKEVAAIESTIEEKEVRLDACVKELNDLNLRSPEVDNPYVDFPAVYDNKDVLLCWKIGEDEIRFWHYEDEPCGKRRLVDRSLVPDPPKAELSSSL